MVGTGIWGSGWGHGLDLALGSQDGSRVNLDVALGACWGARGPPRVGSLSRCLMFLGRIPRGIRPFMGGFVCFVYFGSVFSLFLSFSPFCVSGRDSLRLGYISFLAEKFRSF